MQVGFIGLGTMGAGMAANLQKAGYKLVVQDIRQDSATANLKVGAKGADSPKALAAQCQSGIYWARRGSKWQPLIRGGPRVGHAFAMRCGAARIVIREQWQTRRAQLHHRNCRV